MTFVYQCFIYFVVESPSIITITTLSGTSGITAIAPLTTIPNNPVTITPNDPVTTVSDNMVSTIPNDLLLSSTAQQVVSFPIPKALTELYDESYRLLNKEDLLRKATDVFRSISFSGSECKAIEAST